MKFFHCADIHFGVENYGKIDPTTGVHTRLLDFAKNLELIVNAAIEQSIDFLIFCGDAYKTAQPTPTQQKLFAQLMLRLQQAGIPVVIIVGNHDHPLSFGKAHALDVFSYLPVDGFHVFSKPALSIIQTKSGPVQIIGIPWPTRNYLVSHEAHRFKTHNEIAAYISEKIGSLIADFVQQLDPALPAVLGGHLTVSSGIFSGSEKCAVFGTDPLFLPSQLALSPLDYVALGHLHRYQNLNPTGIPVVYAGSIERVDFGERKEEKGYCAVSIDIQNGQKNCTHTFIALPSRPMIQIELDIQLLDNQTEVILEHLKMHDLTGAIVKIVYHLPEGASDKVDTIAVQRACADAMYLVGIFPQYKPITRERRPALKIDMDMTTLLSRYVDMRPAAGVSKDYLLEKAFEIAHEIDDQATSGEQ